MSGSVLKAWNPVTLQWEPVLVGKQGPPGVQGPAGPPGLDGTGAPIFGQVAKMTAGTITIATQGVYQSTGLTAVLDGENAGISLGTSDTFAIKNTSGVTRRLKISASYDASMAGATKVLGLALAVNGVVDLDTECRATTGLQGAIAKLATQWIIDLADGDEVALYVANHSSTVDIDFQRGRIVATSVAGFGPQGPTGATGATGPGVATGGTTGDLLVKQSSTDFDTAWQAFGLDDLSDVDLTGVGDDDILQFDSALGVFLPVPLPSGGGGVPLGGSEQQVLIKASAADLDTAWSTKQAPGLAYPRNTQSTVKFYAPSPFALEGATITSTLDTVVYSPLWITHDVELIACGVRVITGAAGAVYRIGFYSAGSDGVPESLLLDAGTVDASSPGYKTITGLSLNLSAGEYWSAVVLQGASGAQTRTNGGAIPVRTSNSVANTPNRAQFIQTGVSGALPASPTLGIPGAGFGVFVIFGIA
jgi:hypothetical protein